MGYSDDPASPPAPFGDGSVFDAADVVALSPTTDERVIDTQSGFLVVVRKLQQKLALSVKRRVGTPPSSSIALTPDEALALSKVLASSGLSSEKEEAEGLRTRFRASKLTRLTHDDEGVSAAKEDGGLKRLFLANIVPVVLIAAGLSAAGVVVGLGVASVTRPIPAPVVVQPDLLSSDRVDSFVRNFVSEMLDFSPATYRISQVHAMSVMSDDLLKRYWKETNFPLSNSQLSRLPQGMTVVIEGLTQDRTSADEVMAVVKAQLSDPANPKGTTPVHLRLKITKDSFGQLEIIEQTDVTAQASR